MKEVVPGEQYEMLTMLGEAARVRDAAGRSWRMVSVRCACGVEKTIRLVNWKQKAISCGCFKRESMRDIARARFSLQDGLAVANPVLYGVWSHMLSRCEDHADRSYHDYGGRGITVCDRWHDFKLFLEDIQQSLGPRPMGYVLDRIRNEHGYGPGNVRWASRRVSNLNQRGNVRRVGGRSRWQAKVGLGIFSTAEEAHEACSRALSVLIEAGVIA